MGRRTGWSALLEWSLAFALLALVVAGAMTIGVFLVPVAAAAFIAAGVRNRAWPYLPFGFFTGAGALVTIVGLMHVADARCPTAGTVSGAGSGRAGTRVVSRGGCSSFDARRWLAVGGILAMVGVTGYVVLTRRPARPTFR